MLSGDTKKKVKWRVLSKLNFNYKNQKIDKDTFVIDFIAFFNDNVNSENFYIFEMFALKFKNENFYFQLELPIISSEFYRKSNKHIL